MNDAADVPTRRKLDVDVYHRMADAGIPGEEGRVELIDWKIIDMAPIGQSHASAVGGRCRISQPRHSEPT